MDFVYDPARYLINHWFTAHASRVIASAAERLKHCLVCVTNRKGAKMSFKYPKPP